MSRLRDLVSRIKRLTERIPTPNSDRSEGELPPEYSTPEADQKVKEQSLPSLESARGAETQQAAELTPGIVEVTEQDVLSKESGSSPRKLSPEQRYRQKQIRKEIYEVFQQLYEKGINCSIKELADFIWRYNGECDLLEEALAPFRRYDTYPARDVWAYLKGEGGALNEQILLQQLLTERRAGLEAHLPNPLLVPVSIDEDGPRLDAINATTIHQLVEQHLTEAGAAFNILGKFPLPLGRSLVQLEFPDKVQFAWQVQTFLQQETLPSGCSEALKDVPPLPLSEDESVLKQMQAYLAEVSSENSPERYSRLSAVLITAYNAGYWKSPWTQKLLLEWQIAREAYLERVRLEQQGFPLAEESARMPHSSLVSTDKVLGLSEHFTDENPIPPAVVTGFHLAATIVKRDLVECEIKPTSLGDAPTSYVILLREARTYSQKTEVEQVARFLGLSKFYLESGQETLLRLSLSQYCFSKGKRLFNSNRRKESRPYLQIFLYLYSQTSPDNRRDLSFPFYRTLAYYFGTYNIQVDANASPTAIADVFHRNLTQALLENASRKSLADFGRCILEITIADLSFTISLVDRMKNRGDMAEAVAALANCLQEPATFRSEPLLCLQLLGRIDPTRIAGALSRQSLSGADQKRLVTSGLLRFAYNSSISPNVFLKSFAQQASDDTKSTLAFSVLVEPFILGSAKEESQLKAELMTEILGFPAGTQSAEYFRGKSVDLASLFDRFARSTDPNVKLKHGSTALNTIRLARKWLAEQRSGTMDEACLRFFRSAEAYVTAENAKLIHDTTLEVSLANARALYSPDGTRVTVEIRNVGEGIADSIELEVLPVKGEYEVEDRYRIFKLDMLADKEPVQLDIWVRPIVGANQNIDLSLVLHYNTLKQKEKETRLAPDRSTVGLYPETQFVRITPPPYDIGAPATTWFYGRQHLLESMADCLRPTSGHDTSMIVYGLKRAGKTSVVKRFMSHTTVVRGLDKYYIPVYADLLLDPLFKQVKSDSDFLWFLIQIVVDALHEQLKSTKFLDYLSLRESEFRSDPFGGFSRLLDDVFAEITPKRLLLVLDEFATLQAYFTSTNQQNSLSEQLFGFLSNMTQSHNQLTFVFTGTYVLLEMMREYTFDLAKICAPYMVSFLDKEAARQLVQEPVERNETKPEKGWLEYDPRVVERIVKVTNCHPYLIQYLCRLLVERMNRLMHNRVNLSDISTIIDDVVSKPAYAVAMQALWQEFQRYQHKILSVIAAKSATAEDWVSVNEIAETFHEMNDPISLEDILATCSSLADAELLDMAASNETAYRVTIPLYQMWLKRNKPLIEVFGK